MNNVTVYFVGFGLLALGLLWVSVTAYLAYRYMSLLQRERDIYRAAFYAKAGVSSELDFSVAVPVSPSLSSEPVLPVRTANDAGGNIIASLRKAWNRQEEQAFSEWQGQEFPDGKRFGIRVDDAAIYQRYFDLYNTRSPLDVYRVA